MIIRTMTVRVNINPWLSLDFWHFRHFWIFNNQNNGYGTASLSRCWTPVRMSALAHSVTRWGYFPPKWLFWASPGGENFGGAETAKSLNGGYFWPFLIFISKITKYRDFWNKIRSAQNFFQLFSPIFFQVCFKCTTNTKIFFWD